MQRSIAAKRPLVFGHFLATDYKHKNLMFLRKFDYFIKDFIATCRTMPYNSILKAKYIVV